MKEWINLATAANAGSQFSLDCFILSSQDTRRWCNSMFSNNIRKLLPGQGNLSAICDDRGRVQGFIDVYCMNEEQFFCVLDGVDNDWFQSRFAMYMILDDIEHDMVSNSILHVSGPQAQTVLVSSGLKLPSENEQYSHNDNCHVAQKNRFGIEGYDIISSDLKKIEERLADNGLNLIPQEAFNAVRIMNGRAKWPDDGTDKSMIHELGLNQQCCAFDKGCYVGQEIINRIDVKGLINKKLHRLSIDGDANIGDSVYLNEKEVGKITSLTEGLERKLALSVLRKSAWEKGLVLSVSSGATATVL